MIDRNGSTANSRLANLLHGITSLRDKAWCRIFLDSSLDVEQMTLLDRTTIVAVNCSNANGSAQRLGFGMVTLTCGTMKCIMVGADAMDAIEEYLTNERSNDSEAALFLSPSGGR